MRIYPNILSLSLCTVLHLLTLQVYAADTLCAGEKTPEIKDVTLTCAKDLGILPNTGTDVSGLISSAMPVNGGIFFPVGDYIINQNIVLKTANSLVGSETGTTIFHDNRGDNTAFVGDANYSSIVKNLTIKGIVFNNVRIYFYGNKSNISIINNALINTLYTDVQLAISHNPFIIQGNILLRDEDHPGIGLSTYRNKNTVVEHNIIGDISDSNLIPRLNYYDTGTFELVNKLKLAAKNGRLIVKEDQGYFQSGWYATDGLTDSEFNYNIVAGNKKTCLKSDPTTGNCNISRDHVMYIKQYSNVTLKNNLFSGWPADDSGGAKFRNATGVYFVGNYLDSVDFDARAYKSSATTFMNDTFVFNNFIKEGTVNYYQDIVNSDTESISVSNFVVFDNKFQAKDQTILGIFGTWRNPTGEFLEANNTFHDQTQVNTSDFKNIDVETAKGRIPPAKIPLLSVEPIPLWKYVGEITGSDLKENQLARIDITIGEKTPQFAVYSPDSDYYYPVYRWTPGLTKIFNEKIADACAGVLTQQVTANNACKFMTPIGSSYLNKIYTTTGQNANYTTRILDKYLQVGYISASDLHTGQSVKFSVIFEDGTKYESIYTPPSDYWMPTYRWASALAKQINSDIPGLCAGQYTGVKNNPTEGTKCSFTLPVLSSYLNNIYTINGQSAVTTLSVISQ